MYNDIWKKAIVGILIVALLSSGCVEQKQRVEPKTPLPTVMQAPITEKSTQDLITIEIEPVIEYYLLGGYTGEGNEAFYALPGDVDYIKKSLEMTLIEKVEPKTVFIEEESLNLVVFRGVFNTGGYGMEVEKVEKIGNNFIVYAIYTDPGIGMMVTQAFTQPTAILPLGRLAKGDYKAKLIVTQILKEEGGDKVLEEDKEHASIAFKIVSAKPPAISPPITVPPAPKQLYIKAGQSEHFTYWSRNISINYTSAYPRQMVKITIDGVGKIFYKELNDSPSGIYWKEGNLSLTLKPILWEIRDGQRIPFYEKTWNTTELYFEVSTGGT